MKKICFEDDYIRVIYKKCNSSKLVLTFTNMVNLAKGLNFYAETPLEKLGLSAISFMAKQPNWYPYESMRNAITAIKLILNQFDTIVGYGGSMGGYAVLKYSKLLNLTRAIALDPQYSINQSDIDDKTYSAYYNESTHKNMKLVHSDFSKACEYVVIYDPYYTTDELHMQKILQEYSDIKVAHFKFSRHSTTSFLASTPALNYLINNKITPEETCRLIRRAKKEKIAYFEHLIEHLKGKNMNRINHMLLKTKISFKLIRNNLKYELYKSITDPDKNKAAEMLGITTNKHKKYLRGKHGGFLAYNIALGCFETIKSLDEFNKYTIPIPAKSGIASIKIDNEEYVICNTKNKNYVLSLESFDHDTDPFVEIFKLDDKYYIKNKDHIFISSMKDGSSPFKALKVDSWELFSPILVNI
ncbi:MAG: hypothetical protein QM666_05060 [Acinetobacter sp.]